MRHLFTHSPRPVILTHALHATLWPLALAAVISACSGSEPDTRAVETRPSDSAVALEAVDDAGRIIRLDRPAHRIVSLVPAITETIVALGAGDRVIARTDYDDAPEVAQLPSVGGGLTPSIELIASLQPDLVITWEEAGTSRIAPRLESLGIRVFAVQTRDTSGIYANIDRLGRLLAREEAADSLAVALRGDLETVRTSVRQRPRRAVLYLIGLDPPIIAGPSVFIGELLEVAGGRNAFHDVAAPSPQVSLEEIVARRPEVLLVPTRADSGAITRRMRDTPGWRELLESGTTRVQTLPIDLLHRPGPGIGIAARVLRDAIHPEAAVGDHGADR